MKYCSRCKKKKPLNAFRDKDPQSRDGYEPWCKDCNREYKRTYHQANKEKFAEYDRVWTSANREKVREYDRRRYARLKGSTVEKVNYEAILARDGLWCYLCEKDVEPHEVHFDHVIPLSRGGSHTADNIRVTHAVCNMRKGARVLTPSESKRLRTSVNAIPSA